MGSLFLPFPRVFSAQTSKIYSKSFKVYSRFFEIKYLSFFFVKLIKSEQQLKEKVNAYIFFWLFVAFDFTLVCNGLEENAKTAWMFELFWIIWMFSLNLVFFFVLGKKKQNGVCLTEAS